MFGGVPIVLTVPTGPRNQGTVLFTRGQNLMMCIIKAIHPDIAVCRKQVTVKNPPLPWAATTKGAASEKYYFRKGDIYLRKKRGGRRIVWRRDVISQVQYQ